MDSIDFLPASYLRRQAARQRRLRKALYVCAAGVGLMGWWTLHAGMNAQLESKRDRLARQSQSFQQEVEYRQSLLDDRTALRHEMAIRDELETGVTYTQVIATISELKPEALGLTRIAFRTVLPAPRTAAAQPNRTPRPTAEADPLEQIQIDLSGIAPDDLTVQLFVEALDEHVLFTRVTPTSSRSDTVDNLEVRRFELQLEVDLHRRFLPAGEGSVAHAN